MKKLFATLLALAMVLSMSVCAFAKENTDASFTKTYKITNADTSNPKETFTFTFTADKVTDSNKNLTTAKMPAIPASTVMFDEGAATTEGLEKTVSVALANIEWPGVGVYYYTVNETAGKTAGVTYDDRTAYLKVTVAYDEGTDTYYTAFATLNLADDNSDGITDVKTAGFTNVYTAGKLEVKKTVSGNMGDKSAYFDVTITLTGENGKTYADSYAVDGGSHADNPETIKINEATTFKLKDGETITIDNLPYGVTYTVCEADYTSETNGAYDAAKYSLNGAEATINPVSDEELDTASEKVEITNNKGTTVDTGISLDSMPYILMLAVAVIGCVALVGKKRVD